MINKILKTNINCAPVQTFDNQLCEKISHAWNKPFVQWNKPFYLSIYIQHFSRM